MASGFTVNIKLDKFLQEFLCSYFKTPENSFFSFPKGHDLNVKLGILLKKYDGNVTTNYGENNFKIELLFSDVKNVNTYNHLSKTNAAILTNHISLFYKTVFHEEMNRLRNIGFNKKESVEIFLSNYYLDPKWYDRLIKDYHRYSNRISSIKYRKKKRKKLVS